MSSAAPQAPRLRPWVFLPLGLFVALLVFLALGLNRNPQKIPSPLIGQPAPAFSLSSPAPPYRVSAPAPPSSTLLPLLPVMVFDDALPVPLM